MNFDGDAFISYAHLDNVELVEGRRGWVANLHRALEIRVGQLLGKSPHIWRDPKLSGNDFFADALIDKLRQVAVLVTVVSPRYLKSEWTIRELNEFWRAAEAQGGVHLRNKARVFKVLKTPVPLERTPAELRSLIGYDFFKIEPDTGKVHELDEIFGPDAHRDFWLKLDDLAHDIVALLEAIEGTTGIAGAPFGMPSAPAGGTVFLAETTSDLREAREALRRDLMQQGYSVLPERTIPYVVEEATAAIAEDLARCTMSIHALGRNYGLVPEGGTQSLVEMQYELATRCASERPFARLMWIPSGLKADDARQLKLIEQIRFDPRIGDDADLLESFFEDLRTSLQHWLTKNRTPAAAAAAPPPDAPAAAPKVYVMADPRDAAAAAPLMEELFEQHLEVMPPIFEGDETEIREYHEDSLVQCDGVLIFYGAANELWLRRKLRELQKAAGYGRAKPQPPVLVCLAGPRTPEKERFRTHDAMVAPQFDGFDLAPLAPFIAQLKAGGAV